MALFLIATAAAVAHTSPQTAPQSSPGSILIDRQRVDRARPITTARPAPRRAPTATVSVAAPGTPIKGIRFVGAQAPAPLATAARRFLNRPATQQILTELAAALSEAYADAPVALYSVAIPEQSFADGVVVVGLTEGRIVSAHVAGARPGAHPLLRRRLLPLLAETPLSRDTWERQMTLVQAIPGLAVATALTDPQATGALVLTATPKQKRTRVTAGYSTRGVDLLGDGQWDGSAILYGAATDGDQLSVSASAASDLRRYRYVSGGYSAPIGANGLTAGASVAYLETRPRGRALTGRARQAAASLSYPLIRRLTRSADVSLSVDLLNSDNAAFGNVISNERTRAARLAGSFTDAKTRRELSVSAAVSRGLDALGARAATPGTRTAFTKATASAAASQAIGRALVARVSLSGQWAGSPLPAAERFALGGETIGRGFDTGLLTGDRGAGVLGELALRPIRNGRFGTSEVFVFGDAGTVSLLPRDGFAGQRFGLASAGIGTRARWRDKAELGLEAARVLDDPFAGYDEDWRLTASWRLSL